MVLKEITILSFLLCKCHIRAKMAVLCRGMTWLPTVMHKLAKTYIYHTKHTPLWTYWLAVIHPVCVHSPLPDPWLSWALIWTSCMHEDPNLAAPTLLGNDATVNTGGSLAFPLLFLSDQSYSCCHRKSRFTTATMSQVQIQAKKRVWLSQYIYCSASYIQVTSEGQAQWGCLIMGEHGCAAASLWLGHAPSIGLAIGPRHSSHQDIISQILHVQG